MKQKMKILPGAVLPDEIEDELKQLEKMKIEADEKVEYMDFLHQNEKLVKIDKTLNKQIELLNNIKEKLGIYKEQEELGKLWNEIDKKTKELGEKIGQNFWGPDTFTKGKKDAISSKDGGVRLLRSKRTERKIIPKAFMDANPLLLQELVEEGKIVITLKVAEEKLGKEEIDKVCEKSVTYRYELATPDEDMKKMMEK